MATEILKKQTIVGTDAQYEANKNSYEEGTVFESTSLLGEGDIDPTYTNKFVSKVTTKAIVYGTDSNGIQKEVPYSDIVVNSSIALRDPGGHVNVATPITTTHAANKAYVDAGFVPKKRSTTGTQIYAFDNNGLKDVHMSAGAIESGIAVKDTGGVLAVGTPVGQNDATTKKYVDDAISSSKISAINLTKGITSVSSDAEKGILMSGTSELTLEDGTKKDATMNIEVPIVEGDGIIFYKYPGEEKLTVELDPSRVTEMALGMGTSDITQVLALGSTGVEYYEFGQLIPYGVAEYTTDAKLLAVTDDEEITDPATDYNLVNKAYANQHYVTKTTTAGVVYATDLNGVQEEIPYSDIEDNNSIALRDAEGHINVADPTYITHAANKAYVDEKFRYTHLIEVKYNAAPEGYELYPLIGIITYVSDSSTPLTSYEQLPLGVALPIHGKYNNDNGIQDTYTVTRKTTTSGTSYLVLTYLTWDDSVGLKINTANNYPTSFVDTVF